MFQIGINPLFFIDESKQYLSKLEENKIIGKLNFKAKELDFEVLSIDVYQNLSAVPTDETDSTDFPIIYQENGKLHLNVILINKL